MKIFFIILLFPINFFPQSFWEYKGLGGTSIGNIIGEGEKLYASERQGDFIYYSDDYGESWNKLARIQPDTSFFASIRNILMMNNNIFVSTRNGGIYKSTDGGFKWNQKNTGLESNRVWKVSRKGDSLYAAAEDAMYISTNEGESWIKLYQDSLFIFDFVFLQGERIVAISDSGVLRSDNNGATWNKINNGIQNVLALRNIAVSGDGYIYIGTPGQGVYRSSDSGDTWELKGSSVQPWVDAIAVSPLNYIMTGGEWFSYCYLSTDHGETWKQKKSGLPNYFIETIYFDENNYAYIGLVFEGIYKTTSAVTDVKLETYSEINSYKLYQNYPNPFNPTTNITYSLQEDSKVQIKIYDILGREVAELVNEQKPAGFYETTFDGSELTSGVYIYKIQVNDFVTSKKMILLK